MKVTGNQRAFVRLHLNFTATIKKITRKISFETTENKQGCVIIACHPYNVRWSA